jgi:hypothetical protein
MGRFEYLHRQVDHSLRGGLAMIRCSSSGIRQLANWLVCVAALGVLVTPSARGQGLRPPWSMNGSSAAPIGPTRFGAECAGVVAPRDGTPADSEFHPVSITSITIGDLGGLPSSMHGQTITERYLINIHGGIDSVDFMGRVDKRYAANGRASAAKIKFGPAVYQGCAVRAWSSPITETFGRRAAQPGPFPVEIVGRDWPVMVQAPWTVPTTPFDGGALPESLLSCTKNRPALIYGELPDPASAHGNGRVVLRFVIDSTGVPVDSTVRVMLTPGPAFIAAVRRVFPTLRFQPAWCGGRPVAMDVQYTFEFVK